MEKTHESAASARHPLLPDRLHSQRLPSGFTPGRCLGSCRPAPARAPGSTGPRSPSLRRSVEPNHPGPEIRMTRTHCPARRDSNHSRVMIRLLPPRRHDDPAGATVHWELGRGRRRHAGHVGAASSLDRTGPRCGFGREVEISESPRAWARP